MGLILIVVLVIPHIINLTLVVWNLAPQATFLMIVQTLVMLVIVHVLNAMALLKMIAPNVYRINFSKQMDNV